MMNDNLREKLLVVAKLLQDLSVAVTAIADVFGEIKAVRSPLVIEEKNEGAVAQIEEKKYTLEDVRKALAAKSGAGYTAEVRMLLEKHGASKLSAIDEAEYAAIMEEVQTIGSAQ